MSFLDNWKYKIGEAKIIDLSNNIQYNLVVGYIDRTYDDPGDPLYIRVYNDYDFIFGTWVDKIENETSYLVKDAIKQQLISFEIIIQCVHYAKRIENIKAFS